MVVSEAEIASKGETESAMQTEQQQQHKNHPAFPSLGRQSSIYSLTLDEFQSTLCESGKHFGSMNMDEFLNSIWTAEENQAQAQAHAQASCATSNNTNSNLTHLQLLESNAGTDHKSIAKQPSLPRQGSLTLPEPLCRKTVDQVWSEIHKNQQDQQHNGRGDVQNPSSTQRQLTFGEMTLEDFLVRAGIVREQGHPPMPLHQQPYGMYQSNNNPATGPNFVSRPAMGMRGGVPAYQAYPQSGVGEASGYPGSMTRGGAYPPQQSPAVCYGGRMVNGSGSSYGQMQGLGIGSPVSPVSSDGLSANQMDAGNYGVDMGMRGGRKRIIDGPVEKVVERRQRRMIKNRESAARSRARKQAYTVELEAELNQLKEENAHLKQALADMERKRKQQYFEEMKMKCQSRAQKAHERLRAMRRTLSYPC